MQPDFFLFSRLFVGQVENTALRLKKISQKWSAFVFGSIYLYQTFTDHVSNQYPHFDTWICQMWLQAMEDLLILYIFFWKRQFLKHCTIIKLSQTVQQFEIHNFNFFSVKSHSLVIICGYVSLVLIHLQLKSPDNDNF